MKKVFKTWMFAAILLFLTGGMVVTLAVIKLVLADLPSVYTLERYVPPLVTHVYDTFGNPVGEFFTERRTNIPLTQIPVDLRKAVMAIEDTEFFKHWGINPRAIMRAFAANLKAGRVVQGGSTLTQQLAKTIFLTRKKTYTRKFKELLLTLQIENHYSKDEILQLYLNQIYFGGGAYGVEAAARLYFDKRTQELNLSESALIAGLIRSPNRYSPLKNPDLAVARRATVLNRMQEEGFITEKEEEEANAISVADLTASLRAREAPYFTEEVKKELEPMFGADTLEQGGLAIQTTLNVELQRAAEMAIQKHLENYELQYSTTGLTEYNEYLLENNTHQELIGYATNQDMLEGATYSIVIATIPPPIQAALIALDVQTGAIRAMVGGRDFFESQFNRAIQAQRQPGSAFKPFVWAAALEGRFTPATIVDDNPLVYIDMESDPTLLAEATSYAQTEMAIIDHLRMEATNYAELKPDEIEELRKKYWRPMNYDHRFRGPVTVRTGLKRSRNIISVRLIDSVGPRAVVRLAKNAGIQSWMNPVLSLSLGTSVVNLLELTNAYATFARGGLYAEPYFIERVTDRKGKVLLENAPKVESRIDPRTAFLITNLMKGVVEGGTGWYARRLRYPLAGKTGTTQDQRDVWFIGYSADLACGVWMGFDDFRPLKKGKSASSLAVPLWTDFMREALRNTPKNEFPIPSKIEYAKIDRDTGYLALPSCPHVELEAFREGTVPQEFCPYDHISQIKKAEEEDEEETADE